MENRLQNLIISAQLTPKEKEVADYVLENLQKCCFMTSTELAGELNVSYSSVIRLTKTLGFTGYPDFQNFLRETYAEQSRDVDTGILIPAERIEAIKKKEHKATVQDTVCAYTLSNIQSTIASNTEEQYRKASSILINSGVKYIFSSRGSTCVGEFLNTIPTYTITEATGRTCLTLPATWGKAMRRFLSPIPGIPG